MKHTPALIVITWVLLAALVHARADDTAEASPPKGVSRSVLDLHYAQGLLDAQVVDVPLRQVLSELAKKTGLQVHINDPAIADDPVNSALQAVPLAEALTRILDGFSYALFLDGNTLTLNVLSTRSNSRRSRLAAAQAITKTSQIIATEPIPPKSPDPSAAEREGGPSSLEEFEPLETEELAAEGAEDLGADTDQSTQRADNEAYQEALLQRALNALHSEHKDLHAAAIGQLADLNDPRATRALVEAALNSATNAPQFRRQAVMALRQHVAGLPIVDTASINVLKQLAQDSDQEIRSIANQALQDTQ